MLVLQTAAGCRKELTMQDGLKARINAFFTGFSFLGWEKIDTDWLSEAPKIQRVDLDLMDKWGWTSLYYHEGGDQFRCEGMNNSYFVLFRKDGAKIGRIQQYDLTEKKKVGLLKWKRDEIKGDTVYEGISRLSNPNDIFYILEVRDMWNREDDYFKNVKYGMRLTLHKIPTGRMFSEWITQINDIASEELKAKVAKIDNV